jgi:hypothetical protein
VLQEILEFIDVDGCVVVHGDDLVSVERDSRNEVDDMRRVAPERHVDVGAGRDDDDIYADTLLSYLD